MSFYCINCVGFSTKKKELKRNRASRGTKGYRAMSHLLSCDHGNLTSNSEYSLVIKRSFWFNILIFAVKLKLVILKNHRQFKWLHGCNISQGLTLQMKPKSDTFSCYTGLTLSFCLPCGRGRELRANKAGSCLASTI